MNHLWKKLIIGCLVVVVFGTALALATGGGSDLRDGRFIGEGQGRNGLVRVAVTVVDGALVSVEILEHQETPDISEPAIVELPAIIVEAQSTDVEVITGASLTSKGILEAVASALATARGE